jgi:hypothetical protein
MFDIYIEEIPRKTTVYEHPGRQAKIGCDSHYPGR